mmetsp:Transcript_10360/g.30297  ORF Transcript_10360/g.30297 Transcript_10360/m.30297 type:complete len:356 (-) Transcript_10360:64-1131(-)|eukprot:CAMPEP_0172372456 /NCGR_PEP_ID=MMETSP1060-20121228/47809_1 /TAXON_ID=37318 /ORGANISM="Pseudo-nitzschia pungens, Strain cf. cingulata" /LENGTH=355 /DNA_ID=CAMNT_0013098473 /DNA_START=133 /DNA_END=1200 /DNA_ORIENTATION=-
MASTYPQVIHCYKGNETHGYVVVNAMCRSNDPHFLAKNLNNRAATLIAEGKFKDAISDLASALELAKSDMSHRGELPTCSCKCCSFESSLMTALERDHDHEDDHHEEAGHKRKRSSFSSTFSDIDLEDMDFDDDDDDESDMGDFEDVHVHAASRYNTDNFNHDDHCQEGISSRTEERLSPLEKHRDEGFIYCQALRVNQGCIDEGHYMGGTLSTIVLFNIAIAHHLQAVSLPTTTPAEAEASWKMMQHGSKLYQLAYELQIKNAVREHENGFDNGDWNGSLVSLRFMMLVTNNLGEIHRLVGNIAKQEMCLQHLWGAMMYMFHNCERVVLTQDEQDGFFRNLSPLVTPQECAPSA